MFIYLVEELSNSWKNSHNYAKEKQCHYQKKETVKYLAIKFISGRRKDKREDGIN